MIIFERLIVQSQNLSKVINKKIRKKIFFLENKKKKIPRILSELGLASCKISGLFYSSREMLLSCRFLSARDTSSFCPIEQTP